MVFDKKTKKDVTGIVALGAGLGVGTAIESKLAPPVPVFTQFAPVAAVAAPVASAGIVLRSLKQLPLGKPNVIKPVKEPVKKQIRMRFL